MGIYNTLQSLGFFAGGLMGGQLAKSYGTQGLFLTCAALTLVWLVVAWPMVAPQRQVPFAKTP
jgi:predicted MFS family arabinose efflux permease